ncbi:MAG: 30S ribosomal protein S12 methylthiotransferase RimO [Eubacteriaceae bacterium]|nr:30S ribosomal protein S12 methylthiotransferase RimO [Eubacteriaceae bacterium]
MNVKVAMVSLGCSKNLVDAEIMMGLLDKNKFNVSGECENADYIVVNTCGFIEAAKEESIDTILEMAQYKTNGQLKGLIATGCLSERYNKELMEAIPELDAVIGTGDYKKIVDIIQNIQNKGEKVVSFGNIDIDFDEELPRKISTASYTAYVKIAEGCDNHCTYCIIPKLRGKYRSRKMGNIVKEVKALAEKGTKEIILIAQDTTMYGIDLYEKRMLSDLLLELDKIAGIEWIRVMYAYPENIDDRLIETMKNGKKILHYIDIPLQHTEDRILKLMGRRTDKKSIFDLIKKLRKEIPDIIIRSTMIAGFPGETIEEHEKMLESIKELRIDKLGVFDYSREEGTAAAKMTDQIPDNIKELRQFAAMEVQKVVSKEIMEEYIGQFFDVLIESESEGEYIGRTWMDAPEVDGVVYVQSSRPLEIGSFCQVKITNAIEFDLIGEIEDESAE